MYLNQLKPAKGSKFKRCRVGRGIGSGLGKTSGRGHKGQSARKSPNIPAGFEGGQMPFQRRVPKFGFVSRKRLRYDELRLHELNCFAENAVVNLESLKAINLINKHIEVVKVISSGKLSKSLKFIKIKVTRGAKEAIIQAGGSIEL